MTCISDAFECDGITPDNHFADAVAHQVAALIDITYNHFGRREDDTVIIAVIVAGIKPTIDINLYLLYL